MAARFRAGIIGAGFMGTVHAHAVRAAGGVVSRVAGRTPEDGERLQARGILYAPDYVINAGGIINVSTEYLGDGGPELVRSRIEAIPGRLEQIWAESSATGSNPAAVADAMAQKLIGRA